MPPLTLGYSPCPNDTFIFSGIALGKIPLRRIRFAEPWLEEVEALNSRTVRGIETLDVTKLSVHALGHVLNSYTMLESGAALGRGCGPLLVTAQTKGDPATWTIALPGRYTTAALLLRLFLPNHRQTVIMRFDQIMAAVLSGQADAGVIIHESRFTYQERGLRCVQDLGAWWEQNTGLPVPLGCIAVRKSRGQETADEVAEAVAASIRWAQANQEDCMPYIRRHAQEMDAAVLASHISLYVNHFTLSLGDEGREAVRVLLRRSRAAGIFA